MITNREKTSEPARNFEAHIDCVDAKPTAHIQQIITVEYNCTSRRLAIFTIEVHFNLSNALTVNVHARESDFVRVGSRRMRVFA